MDKKRQTSQDHKQRIQRVINHIQNNIDQPLKIQELANMSFYSQFHFHRIMRSYLGEPLGEYIKRKRLETAVFLLKITDKKIAEISMKVGYENTPSFNKAFKQHFGISPTEYRSDSMRELEFNFNNNKYYIMKNLKSAQPKIKTIKPEKVIYTTELGDYNVSAGKAWTRISEFAQKKRLFGFRTKFYGISYDDPDVTPADKLRYDACMTVSKKVEAEGDIGVKELPGGKYAIFLHLGPYDQLKSSYDYIFGKWVIENNIELSNAPCMEKYLNNAEKTKPEKLKTEIMIPMK